jgi:outer membrane protein
MLFYKNWDIKINYLHLFVLKLKTLKISMKKISIVLIFALLTSATFAQTNLKIGHIDTQVLLPLMPDFDSAQLKMEKYQTELKNQADAMQVEFNQKYQDYINKKDTYTQLLRQNKETELQQMNERIQQFNQSANDDLQKQRAEVLNPVLDKAKKAIADVAKENGFTYILDLGAGSVVYHSDNSIDILPLVKTKLGIKK